MKELSLLILLNKTKADITNIFFLQSPLIKRSMHYNIINIKAVIRSIEIKYYYEWLSCISVE